LALHRHPCGFGAGAPRAGRGGGVAQQMAMRAALQAKIVCRAVLEVGEVLNVEILKGERHAEIVGLVRHCQPPAIQPRRMTMADPVPGMAQPRLALTWQSFTCRQPPAW